MNKFEAYNTLLKKADSVKKLEGLMNRAFYDEDINYETEYKELSKTFQDRYYIVYRVEYLGYKEEELNVRA